MIDDCAVTLWRHSCIFQRKKSRCRETTNIVTSLYDLIEAISEEITAGEDGAIAQTVMHLVDTGRLKFISIPKEISSLRG